MVALVLPINTSNSKKQLLHEVNSLETILVNGIKTGDKKAISQLYKMYSSSLMGIITRIVKFDEIAEDILQDTFIKIWKSIEQYDASKGRLFTWMANLAKNTAIDHLRSKYCSNLEKTDDLNEIPTLILDKQSNNQFNPEIIGLKQLIQNLKPDQKNILDLIYFEGYTHVEVAERLNLPLGTVKTKIRQSILTLRKFFNVTKPIIKSLRIS
ncbi:MAG: sigma-70 family RNA polymerase sigma factor [Pedobacter sp.]|jgi:RNA polymerase sigma-70 factor (ECF subfamily)|uniref:RNA polymerase sigma factor n=1 Tax=Pedobacter sp. TaxID=1411316 RepID=UPI003563BA11